MYVDRDYDGYDGDYFFLINDINKLYVIVVIAFKR